MTLRDTPTAPTDLVSLSPQPGPEPAPTGPRSAPDEVWAQVREDYLAGAAARACCHRYGVGMSALRERAAREGWRRVDQPWTRGARLDPDDEGVQLDKRVDGDLDRVELDQLAFVAWRRMMRAVMHGDAGEALRWRRVRLAMEEEAAELERLMEQEERYRLCGRGADPDSPDHTDSNSADRTPNPDSPDSPDPLFESGKT